jgi:hypothetical protein
MLPPQWALQNSRRFEQDELGALFTEAWSRLQARFLKLKCWQTYQEHEPIKSQMAYDDGDMDRARELVRQEAEADRSFYADMKVRKLAYIRVRVVQEPLTPCVGYELMAYRIRATMGETVEVVSCDDELSLPNEEYFDFLLFDRHTALIHDYGDKGLQSGGWLVTDSEIIASLDKLAIGLRERAIPLV